MYACTVFTVAVLEAQSAGNGESIHALFVHVDARCNQNRDDVLGARPVGGLANDGRRPRRRHDIEQARALDVHG